MNKNNKNRSKSFDQCFLRNIDFVETWKTLFNEVSRPDFLKFGILNVKIKIYSSSAFNCIFWFSMAAERKTNKWLQLLSIHNRQAPCDFCALCIANVREPLQRDSGQDGRV